MAAVGSSGDGGSATSGTIQWWSWTPDNDLAEREIAAFNKQYPDIKVTYKKVPNNDYTAVLRPALASDDGPDVFTVSASGTVGPVDVFGAYAEDLTPGVEKLLGADWKSKVYENGIDSFTAGRPAGRDAVGQGRRRQHVDQQGHVRQVRREGAHEPG